MIRKFVLASLVFLLSFSACTQQPLDAPGSTVEVGPATVSSTATSVPTNTPTPTLTPTATRTPKPTYTPTVTPTPRVLPKGRVTILLLGSDQRPGSGFRTDVIVLLTVDKRKDTVTAVSFPRDLYVEIPGWKMERINTAMPHGGFDLLAETFETNFGVRPDHYVMTNMKGLVEIVDSLEGITVNVGSRFEDECPWALSISKKGHCLIEPGPTEMDGETALWYVRSRKTSSDFDRLRRAQEVLLGIFYRSMRLNAVGRLPGLYIAFEHTVQTDMSVADMLPLLTTAGKVLEDSSRLSRYAITNKETIPHRTETRAAVLLPDYDKIEEILDQAVFAP